MWPLGAEAKHNCRDAPKDAPVLALAMELSAIRAAAARHSLYDLDLFTGTGVLDKMPHVDEALEASVGALEAGVMRLYGVVVLLARWVRGCARLAHVNLLSRLAGSRRISRQTSPRGHFLIYPIIIALILDTCDVVQYSYSKLVRKEEYLESLKEIRRRHGLSQIDLSGRSGVAQNTISDIETGRREPRPSTLRKLAKSLGVEVAAFYPETSHPKVSAPSSPEEWLRAHGGHLLRLTDAELRREFRELPDEDRQDFMERLSREFGEIQAAYERESEPRAAVIQDAYALASGRFLLATEVSGILKAYFVEEDNPEQVTILVGQRPKDILERLEEYLVEQESQEAYERNP